MRKKIELDEKWIKASIIGTIWAASEIVLGSFLHNLRIPFSGNLLTGIGLIILISISYKWTDQGLFWRSGLICALMKTISPSAVIFGPMIAIMSEAFLLELSVRLFGRTWVGFLLGSILAMSWNLFHKILNLIIFYGANIVELYTSILKYAQKQLNIEIDIIWVPILVLLFLYCLMGIAAALIGIKIGRQIISMPPDYSVKKSNSIKKENHKKITPDFNYSLIWLTVNVVLIITSLVLLNYTKWIIWSISILSIVTIWAFRYKRALKQLSKPKLWISFVLITMTTAIVFTTIQSDSYSLMEGLLIGIQMNFRAVIIISGFSVIGTELYNPVIREFFLKTSFKQLPVALELSFESLPSMFSNIPDFKSIIKNPVSVIIPVILQAENRLNEINRKLDSNQKVFLLTGKIGEGKTTFVTKLIDLFRKNNIKPGGIYTLKVVDSGEVIGYDIVDISDNEQEVFLRIANDEDLEKIGRFSIFPNGLAKGSAAITSAINSGQKIIIVDEVGKLELNDRGWASNIRALLSIRDSCILIVVRDTYVEQLIQKWDFPHYQIFSVKENDYLKVGKVLLDDLLSISK